MSRKRASGESIDVLRRDDWMICVEDVDSSKCRSGGAYEMADIEEYNISITQHNTGS